MPDKKNSNLTKAKRQKKDEFYTQLTDIEKELVHYKDFLRGKVVFCNCDDPKWSNFWRYFHLNFSHIGLKKLIATHYDAEKATYKLEYEGGDDANVEAGKETPLKQNGDFRSPECIELLQEADVVITNPPFSLFREYVAQLIQYNKKFIIIGNQNAVTYKDIFPLIKDNKIWYGFGFKGGATHFISSYDNYATASDKKEGMIRVSGVVWFTNVDHDKRHEPLTLFRRYYDDPSLYPHYDNYDAINVDKVADIPCDYFEAMGVPITFLDKYCPDQFLIEKFRHGDDGKDLTYSVENDPVQTDRQTDRQTDTAHYSVLPDPHPTQDVTELWECQLRSSISSARNSLKLLEQQRVKVEASQTACGTNNQVSRSLLSMEKENIKDYSSVVLDKLQITPQIAKNLGLIDTECNFRNQMFTILSKYFGFSISELNYCTGIIGVPITWLDKYCPEQFEIVWTTDRGGDGELEFIKLPNQSRYDAPTISQKGLYKRIMIKRKG